MSARDPKVTDPSLDESGATIEWYLDVEQQPFTATGTKYSQLRATMLAAIDKCQASTFTSCYSEVMVNTESIWETVPQGAPEQYSPRPTGDPIPGAILAFFYLNIDDGHYPQPATTAPSYRKDCPVTKWTKGSSLPDVPVSGDYAACNIVDRSSFNGQCDTMQRWLIYQTTYKQTAPLVELDLLARKDPFKLICAFAEDPLGPCLTAKQECTVGVDGNRPIYPPTPPYQPQL